MKIIDKHSWIFCILILSIFSSCKQEKVFFYPHSRVLQLGDDIEWAQPDYDHSNWDYSGQTHETGKFWVRFDISFDDRINKLDHKGIQMISLGSYEAYWDGVLIHANGKVGEKREDEIEGKFISQILIPDSLSQIGNHVLALRLSNFHNKPLTNWSWNTFKVEEFHHSVKEELQFTAVMFILGGGFLIVSLYYFFLFIKEKRKLSTFLFSTICLLFFVLIIFEFLKFFWSYTRLLIIGWLTATIAFVIPWFLSLHFQIPKRNVFLTLLLISIVTIGYTLNIKFDTTNQLLSTIMLISSILVSAYAVYLKRKSSFLILLSFLVVAAINYYSKFSIGTMMFNYDINLFLSFLIIVLAFLYALSQQRKEQQEAYQATLLHSERLKNELLKKNIQPHFIMNTLTSIMEWVESSPKKSLVAIEALAEEFTLLNDMADEKLVPISQEIDLCKKHLEIMTFRKEVRYIWEDENVDLGKQIPPAIFHTIIENGITHSKVPSSGEIKFLLTQENTNKSIVYRIEVFANNRKPNSKPGSGTGFKYIRSRLKESYGENWSLKSHETPTGWNTIIEIMT